MFHIGNIQARVNARLSAMRTFREEDIHAAYAAEIREESKMAKLAAGRLIDFLTNVAARHKDGSWIMVTKDHCMKYHDLIRAHYENC